MQTLGLALQYKNEKNFRKEVKKILSWQWFTKKFFTKSIKLLKKGC
jgi:hypothetical protein